MAGCGTHGSRDGADAQTTAYRSRDRLDSGVDDDRYLVARLPIAAPEIIRRDGRSYVAALNPGLNGIRVAKLAWTR